MTNIHWDIDTGVECNKKKKKKFTDIKRIHDKKSNFFLVFLGQEHKMKWFYVLNNFEPKNFLKDESNFIFGLGLNVFNQFICFGSNIQNRSYL